MILYAVLCTYGLKNKFIYEFDIELCYFPADKVVFSHTNCMKYCTNQLLHISVCGTCTPHILHIYMVLAALASSAATKFKCNMYTSMYLCNSVHITKYAQVNAYRDTSSLLLMEEFYLCTATVSYKVTDSQAPSLIGLG